jgi:transmembrane sensor
MYSGKLVYSSPIGGGRVGAAYNTLSTPRGGQYKLILPDGTKVWLNAASTIRFPIAFSGAERKVLVSGEVYFEVTHDSTQPFFVDINSGNASIEVLGTHFNVNAYADEPEIRATLLEGSVKVIQGNKNELIVPGEQALIAVDRGSGILINKHVDLDDVVAWKNGQTNFSNLSIEAILRIVSRWYDVDIIYESKIPERRLNGGIPRNAPLSDVIKVLQAYQIHTRLEGKKLFVKT